MNRSTRLAVVPVIAASIALTGCGGKTSSSASSVNAGTTTSANSATTSATTASDCPTSNTKAFAKTRFVTDVGLAAGTFHRYIYKPYQAGTFTKGAKGRTTAMIKAGTVALVDAKLVENAYKNVQASPALCKALIEPLGKLKDSMGSLKSEIAAGNTASIASIGSVISDLEGKASSNGATITENQDLSAASAAENQG